MARPVDTLASRKGLTDHPRTHLLPPETPPHILARLPESSLLSSQIPETAVAGVRRPKPREMDPPHADSARVIGSSPSGIAASSNVAVAALYSYIGTSLLRCGARA